MYTRYSVIIVGVMKCNFYESQTLGNRMQSCSPHFFVLFFWVFGKFLVLLTELNEITIALLRFHYREARQKKNISIINK